MPRALLCFAAVGLFALPCRAEQSSSNPETLIRLEVSPAPEPRPALRYLLLPELKEMNPGNPIFNYFKCCMEQQSFLFDKEAYQHREELLAMPLKELPARELQDYGRSALSQADRAARLDTPDWQILPKLKTDGFYLLLPDVQQMRGLARALQVRFRAEVALGRFDDAIRTAKTMFAMSRHLGEHPTIIGNLVGIAIAYVAIVPLEEMLGQPGCPNLYWALTNLPDHLVPLATGMEGERVIVLAEFRDLVDSTPMSADQLKTFIAHMDKLLADEESIKAAKGLRAWLDGQTKDEAKVTAARRRLVESGLPEERLRGFPAAQVILLDERHEYEVRRDDVMKTVTLPIWQAEAVAARIPKNRPPALLADALVPSTNAVRRARARLDQRIGLLRQVEALRLHAAEHDGKLPAKLSEISVPLPDDPVTGKPFRYDVKGTTAHLRGSPFPGAENDPFFNVHYELTLRK
jgi:hypothetical protein